MIWIVRGATLVVFTVFSVVVIGRGRQMFSDSVSTLIQILSGILVGLVVLFLSAILGKLGRKLSNFAPVWSHRIGVAFFWIGCVTAAYFAAVSAYAAYSGEHSAVVVRLATIAFMYWGAGWGLRRALSPSASSA